MAQAADVVRRKIAAFNGKDATRIQEVLSPDCVQEVPGAHLQGVDQVLAWWSGLCDAFPDIHSTITRLVEEGSAVAILGRTTATHSGTLRTPAGDIPPTGRRVELTFADDYEVQRGLVVSSRLHFDRLELLEQLGVTPVPATA